MIEGQEVASLYSSSKRSGQGRPEGENGGRWQGQNGQVEKVWGMGKSWVERRRM